MKLMKKVVSTTHEFDLDAINKLVNEEQNSLPEYSNCNSYLHVSLSYNENEKNVRVTVNICATFRISNDNDNEYNFGNSFVLTNEMSQIHVRDVVKEILRSFMQSFKDCVKSDIESLQEFLNNINANVPDKGGI